MSVDYKLPNMMKRNARYRGPRESEKYLHDHQEQIFTIRDNWKDIDEIQTQQALYQSVWINGENSTILVVHEEISHIVDVNTSSYSLRVGLQPSQLVNLMVKLNETILSERHYMIQNGRLVLLYDLIYQDHSLTAASIQHLPLHVSYDVRMIGIAEMMHRMQGLNERIGEAERRYQQYANAYE